MSGTAAQFEVFTLFPDMFEAFSRSGLLGKAIERSLVQLHVTNYRDFTADAHKTVDDAPFGGGGGMVMKVEPVVAALEHAERERGPFHRILLTPTAPTFDQSIARRLAAIERVGLICGRYEGIDDRLREHFVDECLSIGDFVLNGGEVAAAAIIESVSRLHDGVLGNPDSAIQDSFSVGAFGPVLEHPHYTRPVDFRGHGIPDVLVGGDHGAVQTWRDLAACERTWRLRPQLRPRTHFAPGHPWWLAVDEGVDASTVSRLADLGLGLEGVLRVSRRRDVVREVGGRGRAAPHLVGLGPGAPHAQAHAVHLCALADLISVERGSLEGDLPPIVLVWPPELASRLGAKVWFAPNAQSDSRSALATADAMIDISQPRSEMDRAALASRLLGALENSRSD